MTWSIALQGGDFAVSGAGSYQQVTGPSKLIQDLKCWILTPQGSNAFHPSYGSTLDGGITADGTLVDSPIGQAATSMQLTRIESEIRRVLSAYQDQQIARLQMDQAAYAGKNTFSTGEILASVDSVDVQQISGTMIMAQVKITTQDGSSVTFLQAVS